MPGRIASVLARSCHPVPSAAVTVFGVLLSVRAGNSGATTAILALAVLSGQLSIGWSNDRIDAIRDRRTGRTDKPLSAADAPLGVVDAAIAVSVGATVAFSLALGLLAGVVHLGAVAAGWSYNVALKSTWASWVPFALAFGALPAVATLALPGHPAPAAWLAGAGAALGVAGHLTNATPDLADDRRTGVVGFPHRVGARAALTLATLLLAAASALVVFGRPGTPGVLTLVAFGAVVATAAAGLVAARRRPDSRWPFLGIVVLVGVDLVLLMAIGSSHELLAGH